MIDHFLGKTHKFGANKTHFAKWWISPVVSIQIDFLLVKGQKRHIQKVLCKASRRSNCCLNDALDPCHQVPFIFIFTAIIIVIINTKMKPLKSVWVVPHGWTLNQHETWNMKHHPWRWKRIVQDQELNPLQAIHYPEGADDGRISSLHQSTKTCVLFKSLLVRYFFHSTTSDPTLCVIDVYGTLRSGALFPWVNGDHWNLDPILNFRRLALEASLNIPGRPYCWWKKSPQQLEAAKSFQGSLMGKIASTLEFKYENHATVGKKDSWKHSSSLPSIVEPRFPVPPSFCKPGTAAPQSSWGPAKINDTQPPAGNKAFI